jgi:3' terminal RNA ribose 2'-O-methyltransferase Hen1
MLLTITNNHSPATDLGYLLHKNPARVQSFDLAFGQAHVFYPEVSIDRCTAALLLDIDPVGLVRRDHRNSFALAEYVNDRPYASSSFLSVAIAQVYSSALNGKSKERPELASQPIALEAKIAALPCSEGEVLLRRLFEPLGYTVDVNRYALDEAFPAWGESSYYSVALTNKLKLSELLSHLYVLVPVLDDDKHYYVSDDEVDKLLRHGEGWLAQHPERKLITRRYLKHQSGLTQEALARLMDTDMPQTEVMTRHADAPEAIVESKMNLHQQRLGSVMSVLKHSGARRVLDLGCGEGQLLRLLMQEPVFEEIVGMDVSVRTLEIAAERLNLSNLPPLQRQRLRLLHGSLLYRDARLTGYDAAVLIEVIEHIELSRLPGVERVIFEFAHPQLVVITTPNREYNVHWETLPAGKFRHNDHRFEWTRVEFQEWSHRIAQRFGYNVRFLAIGDEDPLLGAPTQMAVFEVQNQ